MVSQDAPFGAKMQLDPRMRLEPGLHRRGRVGGRVVHHDVQLATATGAREPLEKRQEVGPGMPGATFAEDPPTGHLERGVQARQAIPAVVVRLAGGQPGPQREQRVRAAQGLNLRLLTPIGE
jgi:hypothetical protein